MTSPAIGKSLRRGSVVAIFLRHRCCVSWHVFGIQLCVLLSPREPMSKLNWKEDRHPFVDGGWLESSNIGRRTTKFYTGSNCNHPSFTCVFVGISVVQMFTSSFICKHLEYWNSWDLCHVQSYLEKKEFEKPWQAWNSFWTSRGSLFETFGLHRRRFPWHAMFWVWFISSSNAMGLRTLRRGNPGWESE